MHNVTHILQNHGEGAFIGVSFLFGDHSAFHLRYT